MTTSDPAAHAAPGRRPSEDGTSGARRRIETLLGGAAVFLALSDVGFSVRAGGMNFRAAQAILLVAALSHAWTMRRRGLSEISGLPRAALLAGAALCVSFSATTSLASEPAPTALRAAWFVFNFAVSAGAVAFAARRGILAPSLLVGVAAVAAVVWIDAVAMHWLEGPPLLGGAQSGYLFEGAHAQRPQAFAYEPSYAACALALGAAATLCPAAAGRRARVLVTALVLSAVVLTSSRAGLLTALVATVAAAGLFLFVRAGKRPLADLALAWATAAALLAVFAIDPGGNRHLRLLAGPLGLDRTAERLSQVAGDGREDDDLGSRLDRLPPEADARAGAAVGRDVGQSELRRLDSYLDSLDDWRAAPWFGHGAERGSGPDADRRVAQGSISGWLGLLAEFGAAGALLYALLWAAVWRSAQGGGPAARLLTAVLVGHFAVSLLLGPSFVRLDYVLLVLGAVRAYAMSDRRTELMTATAPGA